MSRCGFGEDRFEAVSLRSQKGTQKGTDSEGDGSLLNGVLVILQLHQQYLKSKTDINVGIGNKGINFLYEFYRFLNFID